MQIKFLMGNEAIALGALHAGVNFAAGYPGTPSTEILESLAKFADDSMHVEWSVNEKAALEVAAGASYAGARTLVTMKQVGLNVASDPVMSLAYVGIKGGMVIVSADDPGPISSQTEQDTRNFAQYSKLPVFDPSSPEEAYEMIQYAFEFSERHRTPVLFRPTTRICHSCASIQVKDVPVLYTADGFVRDPAKWVIFPRASYLNHKRLVERYNALSDELSDCEFNFCRTYGEISGATSGTPAKRAIACGGISYAYVMEALASMDADVSGTPILKISTAYPFPDRLALDLMEKTDEILCVEELDPVIERELTFLAGKHKKAVSIRGKYTDDMPVAGENTVENVKAAIAAFLGFEKTAPATGADHLPALPVRPPVLCAGCPHRASFYAVKCAMKGKKAVFSGDIGCYTLGNAQPLDMVDTCLCMGAGITIAQGLHCIEPDTVNFAFVGDSTFFASGMTGIVNAVYNNNDIVIVVLDNSTTAMTGQQPHPGTGKQITGAITEKISIERVLEAVNIKWIETVNPLDHAAAVDAVRRAAAESGVRAIVFRSPCIAVSCSGKFMQITDACIGCKKCIRELGCPAISLDKADSSGKAKVRIDASLCTGCGLCASICPCGAIIPGDTAK